MGTRNERLRAAREASSSPRNPGAELSRDELAEAVNRWLSEHTDRAGAMDGQAVARYERGRVRRPGRDYRAALRAVLGAESDVELGFDDAPARFAVPPTDPGAPDLDVAEVASPNQQERMRHAVRYPHRVDHAGLAALADVLAGVRRLEDETSAADVEPAVLGQQQVADRLADQVRDGLRSHAVGLASEIAQYRGWLAIPMQRWDASRNHLERAVALALEADDPLRFATALSFSAYRAMRCDDLRAAAALAAAADRENRVDPGLRTYLAFQRAEIAARGGNRLDAGRFLDRGDQLIDQLPPTEELPSSGYWYVPPFFLGSRALVLDALGDRHAARDSAAACLAEMPPEWSASEWATRRRDLAEA